MHDGRNRRLSERSRRTLERRQKGREFKAALDRGKAKGKISLRHVQFKIADKGSASMAMFLGKQYLGQAEDHPQLDRPSVLIVMPQVGHKDEGLVIYVAPGRTMVPWTPSK